MAARCADCGAWKTDDGCLLCRIEAVLLCRIEAVPGDDRHEPTTYDRLKAAHPDRVGRSGYWADLDGYRIVVASGAIGTKWELHAADWKFISGGYVSTVDAAWRAGCDALDAEQALTDQLAELDG